MRRLALDYQRADGLPNWVGAVLLAAGALATVFVVLSYQTSSEKLTAMEARVAEASAAAGRKVASTAPADEKKYGNEIKQAKQVVLQLALPWGEIFTAVETASTPDVALLSLQPDPQQNLLRITAETRSAADMLAYVKRVAEDRRLADVHLLSHQVQLQDAGKPIRFSVQATLAAIL